MSQSEYDLKLIAAVIGVRKLRGLKQENIANDLGIYRTYIVKMEKGEVIPRTGKLNEIATILKTTIPNLLKVAEAIDMLDFETSSTEEIHRTFLKKYETTADRIDFTKDELLLIFSAMKRCYPKLARRLVTIPAIN